jgi:general stress protein 26
MDEVMRSKILGIIASQSDMTIATLRDDGFPQATMVSYASEGLTLYFGTAASSQKASNIARNNRVSVVINHPYQDWLHIRGLSMGAIAERITDRNEIGRIGRFFISKFPQVVNYLPAHETELAMFRVTPKVISVLDYSKGFGHTDLVFV